MVTREEFERRAATAERQRETRRTAAEKARREARALYSTTRGAPTLKPSFALYLDELGVKNRSAGLRVKELRRSLDEFDRLSWFLHGESDEQWQRMLTFSDSVVVGMPVDPEVHEEDGGLHWLVFSAAYYQLNLAVLGRFLRGGLAFGPLYMDDRTVVGHALVKAVALESETCVHPRVVLDEQCTELALRVMDQYGPHAFAESPTNAYLLLDADGRVFVNYLIGTTETGEDDDSTRDALVRHRGAVTAQLLNRGLPDRVREKYLWAAAYHNFFVDTFTHHEDPAVKVTEGLAVLEGRYPRSFRLLAERPDRPAE